HRYSCSSHHPQLPPFPTRRSSDLAPTARATNRAHLPSEKDLHEPPGSQPAPPRERPHRGPARRLRCARVGGAGRARARHTVVVRSEEHTSELQSRENLVCRLLLEK